MPKLNHTDNPIQFFTSTILNRLFLLMIMLTRAKKNRLTIKCCILILLIGTFHSCLIRNTTKYAETNKCDIHNVKMHKAIVKVHYGYACPRRTKKEYKNAKSILCMGCVVGPYRLAIKYHCQQCDKLKKADKAYWKQHDKERNEK